MKERGKKTSKGSPRNLMEEKDSERMDWILIEHQEKGVEQDRRGQRKKRMRESSGRKTLRLV